MPGWSNLQDWAGLVDLEPDDHSHMIDADYMARVQLIKQLGHP